MKQLLGIALIISGVCLGFYVGVWVFFMVGIVDVIEQIRAPILEAKGVAIGIAKVLFAGFAGIVTGAMLFTVGSMMLDD